MNVFVVRIWSGDETPATASERSAGLGERRLRGVVHHVRSGSETMFVTPGELFAFLAAPATDCTPDAGAAGAPGTTTPR